MSLGIYWIFFESQHGSNEMRLQIEASNKEQAIKFATEKATKMKFGWKFTKAQGVR